MYSQEQQQYACNTGCKTPTIDTTFPNRTHLYGEGNLTAKIDLLLPPVEDTVSFFLNSFFLPQQSTHFDNLTMHAESMEMLVMPYLRSDVTVLTDDVSQSGFSDHVCRYNGVPVFCLVLYRVCTDIENTALTVEVCVFASHYVIASIEYTKLYKSARFLK